MADAQRRRAFCVVQQAGPALEWLVMDLLEQLGPVLQLVDGCDPPR